MAILVTGGTGYIGSHTIIDLIENNDEVIIVDNLLNSCYEVLNRIELISSKKIKFYKVDLLNKCELEKIFKENKINAVIHFAALKAVGESVELPLKYYENNIVGTINLLQIMEKYNVKKFVFSSSATVYGEVEKMPIHENNKLAVTNPYGRTKLIVEDILRDIYNSDNSWGIVILRYFNPVGSHKSGIIGEDPKGVPNNLMPYITRVAIGKMEKLNVFGNDYPTVDGTGVRDYIHVTDLAKGHIKALDKIRLNNGIFEYNLGTGEGYSVLQLIDVFSKVNNVNINYEVIERREGDVAICYADVEKARKELGWIAEKNIEDMCRDAWNWQTKNPNGYMESLKEK
ncbi:UDP-glucose 4-epimerase GalE [Clostridium tertium]|jgi:UDP-glucose 4-epimerase|uniref:UDP-glucose 4-epimerase GalE n=1 Tax=Clostridium tertium TaxID=1559 RepID=UPI000DD0934C|nr:UDP-glucose 4-epimerase GalE [Clostridium tertium]